MFCGFNDAARLAMRVAEVTARSRRRDAVETEDVLLALLQLHGCVAARVLRRAGIDAEAVRRAIRCYETPGTCDDAKRVRLTPAVREAVTHATVAARARLGHPVVGTGHLLLGLLEEAEGVAYVVLCRLGIGRLGGNLSRVAEHVVRAMREGGGFADGGEYDGGGVAGVR